jgi:hypothetical protein
MCLVQLHFDGKYCLKVDLDTRNDFENIHLDADHIAGAVRGTNHWIF